MNALDTFRESPHNGANVFGDNVKLEGEIRVGYATTVGDWCLLRGTVLLGRYCQLGPRVSMFSRDHPYRHATNYVNRALLGGLMKSFQPEEPIILGHDVWIWCGAILLKGVQIGHGAIIGAGSVVTNSVDNYAIVAGNPARAIRPRFPEAVAEALLDLAWWDLDLVMLDSFRDLFSLDLGLDQARSLEMIQACRERKNSLVKQQVAS